MPPQVIVCPQCGKTLKLREPAGARGRVRCPACDHRFPLEADKYDRDANREALRRDPEAEQPAGEPLFVPLDEVPAVPGDSAVGEAQSGIERLRTIQRRGRRRRNSVLAITGGLILAIGAGFFLLQTTQSPRVDTGSARHDDKRTGPRAEIAGAGAFGDEKPSSALVESAAKKAAGPILLTYLPAGVRIVIHLHPAELWDSDRQHNELRNCLNPLFDWGRNAIRKVSGFEPQDIEEATFGVVLKGQGVGSEIAAVIRLVAKINTDDLKQRFPGEVQPAGASAAMTIWSANRAVLQADEKTIAIGPRELVHEISVASETPNPTDAAIEELTTRTDRRCTFTIVCRPDDLLLHREALAGRETSDLLRSVAEWFDPTSVEGVAWSLQIGETFESHVLLRNRSEVTPRELKGTLRGRLDELPRQMLTAIESMKPADAGRRRVIGRFPAMLKAGVMETRDDHAARLVEWNTLLPVRAAPNLALAALLTWDESRCLQPTRSIAVSAKPKGPDSIVERLKKPIAIDFRRSPLHEAIAYISEETAIPIELDGDGLKQAGYTRNMPQSLQLGTVPAMQGLAAILKPYNQMVLLIDEKKQSVVVTIRSVAEARGMKPLDLTE